MGQARYLKISFKKNTNKMRRRSGSKRKSGRKKKRKVRFKKNGKYKDKIVKTVIITYANSGVSPNGEKRHQCCGAETFFFRLQKASAPAPTPAPAPATALELPVITDFMLKRHFSCF